ncbi:hypothetical protein N7474_007369 [Penicillium riverlandense]|uniref:uncharacterized protein n=1 Tax=Penicillium riverlandense TaxID=1903569 RepID=UPI0025497E4E|nr:uncharacterized protein N7474_007369 [Penicillium riverlandense]KAJ5815592.1 hypothetical protein N7474_007369 [Penicillium riverlandense]
MPAATENGHAPKGGAKPVQRIQRSKSPLRWTIGLVVRLCIWYTLLTPFLRCPSDLSQLDKSSPRVCKPYLIARSQVEPYVTPYYNTYAAPYVDQAWPYVEVVHERVYVPASEVAKLGYDRYGAPALGHVQAFGAEQWRTQVMPVVRMAQDKADGLYMAQVDPYVQQGLNVVSPYYQKANAAASTVYWDHFVPFYTQSKPFIGKTYVTGQDILATHVMPGVQYTWSSVVYFANSSLWPHVTGLYSEQVEPQLVKIGQRLASYREGKKLRAVVEDVDSSSSEQPVSTVPVSEETEHTSSTTTTTSTATLEVQPPPPPAPTLSPTEQAQQDRERIDSDLQRWQGKFAAAADKGIEDLEARIDAIVSALIASSVKGHGESLSTALETVSNERVSSLKQHINEMVESLPEEEAPEAEQALLEQLVGDIRQSAISVRDRAHALRQWYLGFDDELMRRVSAAVNSTLDVLDSIRDLGLQEVGTRWAWMDSVTYEDWTKYHALKAQLEDWRNEIREVGVNHKSVAEAKSVANEILDHAMEIAEQTAKELVRLKDVGQWKMAAREVSDNFDTRTEPPPPRPQPVKENEEESEENADGDHDDTSESHSDNTATASEDEGDTVLESESPEPTADEDVSDNMDEASDFDIEEEIPPESVLSDEAGEHHKTFSSVPSWGVAAADVGSQQDPILDDDDQDRWESWASQVDDKASSAIAPLAHISSIASSRLSEGLSSASMHMAQFRQPASTTEAAGVFPHVLDAQRRYYEAVGLAHDHYSVFISTASQAVYGTPTPTPAPGFQGIIDEAGSRYEHASSLASASLSAVIASASSLMSQADDSKARSIINEGTSRYKDALSAAEATLSVASASASSAIYGTPTGTMEALASQASENWENLVSKASEQVYGTPPPYLQQVVNDRLVQFEAVQELVSELVIGKQPSFTESVMSRLHAAYQTPYPAAAVSFASSYISEAYDSASSAAASIASEVPTVEDVVDNVNEQAHAAAGAISAGIYGTPKGSFEQATEAAADAYATVSASASSAIYAQEPEYMQIARDAIKNIRLKYEAAISGDETGAVDELSSALKDAKLRLHELASSATSAMSDAAETASSHVADVTSSLTGEDATEMGKDEL